MLKNYTYNISTLPSGLRLLHIPFEEAASVYVCISGKVGRRAERANEVGAAHFLEHLFFDGTPSHPSATALSTFIDWHGADHNGTTSTDTVEYFTHALPEKAEVCMEYLSDIFFNSLLRDADIEKERKVIKEEASSRRDEPSSLIGRKFWSVLYPGQAIGRTILDEEENLPHIQRAQLLAYMQRNYHAQNFVLCVAGNIQHAEAQTLAEKYFSTIRSGPEVRFDPALIAKEGSVTLLHKKDLTQAKLRIGFSGFAHMSTEAHIAGVLGGILGGMSSSRLFTTLRDELHLVYGIGAGHTAMVDTGYFSISTSLQEDKMPQAVEAIFAQIQKLLEDGVTDEELERVKNSIRTDIAFGVERVVAHAEAATNYLLFHNTVPQPHDELDKILRITKADVLRIARQIFADAPKVVALSEKIAELQIPSLHLGPIHK